MIKNKFADFSCLHFLKQTNAADQIPINVSAGSKLDVWGTVELAA
jgi:hypothetical protein